MPLHYFMTLLFLLFSASLHAYETVTISGSSTVKPIMDALASSYHNQHKEVLFFIRGGGSSIGIRDAGKELVDIGMASRQLKSFEADRYPLLKTYHIGYDALVFIVHKTNPIDNLNFEDVQNIYLGTVRNFEEIGGTNMPIEAISKRFGRATLDIFLYYFDLDAINSDGAKGYMQLKKQRHVGGFSSFKTKMLGSNSDIIDYIATHNNAVAYISYGEAIDAIKQDKAIKIVTLDGDVASKKNIYSGKYPLRRYLNLMMYDDANSEAKAFIQFITSKEGQKVIESKGFLLKLR